MIATTTKPTTAGPSFTLQDLARQVEAHAAELAGFLDGADLPAELELDVAANIAAAEGLLARAMNLLAEAGPIAEAPAAACTANGNGRCSR